MVLGSAVGVDFWEFVYLFCDFLSDNHHSEIYDGSFLNLARRPQ